MLKKLITASFVTVLASVFAINAPATAAENTDTYAKHSRVRVMSFNIHHGADHANVLDLERIALDIESSGADIIGLQEVDNHFSSRSDFVDQAAWFAERLDMHVAYGANLDRDPASGQTERSQYGNAILSDYPILSSQNHLLNLTDYPERKSEQRGLVEAVINIRGERISFFTTHLDSRRTEQRLLQVKDILAITESHDRPTVVVGDMNARPNEPEVLELLTEFDDTFADLGQGDEFTYPSDTPIARIDYILTRGIATALSAEVIHTKSSDHFPIIADLTIATE